MKTMEADLCIENERVINESGERVNVSVIVGDEECEHFGDCRGRRV